MLLLGSCLDVVLPFWLLWGWGACVDFAFVGLPCHPSLSVGPSAPWSFSTTGS